MRRDSQSIQNGPESIFMFEESIGDAMGSDIRTDQGRINRAGDIGVTVIKGNDQKSVPAGLKIRLGKQRGQICLEKRIGGG